MAGRVCSSEDYLDPILLVALMRSEMRKKKWVFFQEGGQLGDYNSLLLRNEVV